MHTIDTSKRGRHRDDGAVPALPVPPGLAALAEGYCSWDCYEADDEEDARTRTRAEKAA